MLQLPEAKPKPVDYFTRGPLKGMPKCKPFSCKLLELSVRYEKLVEQWEQLKDNTDTTNTKTILLYDKMYKIAVRASYMSAESYDGAVFQIMLASSRLDGIRTSVSADIRRREELLADRLLYRAMDRFDWKHRQISPRLREFLMPAHCDQKKPNKRRVR